MDLKELKKPFPEWEIEWRVGRAGEKNGKIWCMVLAYVTNRAIMDRLDDVVGPGNWKNEYKTAPEGGVLCGLSIRMGEEWVTKWDGAENTNFEAVKGGLSGAMKRAAVQWGIGRYLYGLEATFGAVSKGGRFSGAIEKGQQKTYYKWNPPKLPAWALPVAPKAMLNKATNALALKEGRQLENQRQTVLGLMSEDNMTDTQCKLFLEFAVKGYKDFNSLTIAELTELSKNFKEIFNEYLQTLG